MQTKLALLSLLALAAGSAPAWAGPPDPFRGQAYAQAMCASCHAISKDKPNSPNPAAKPFMSITLAHGSGEALADWINTKHPSIPMSLLKASQAEDIIAYIASVKASAAR
jgi:cytochrome c2